MKRVKSALRGVSLLLLLMLGGVSYAVAQDCPGSVMVCSGYICRIHMFNHEFCFNGTCTCYYN